jgi:iron(III) transport system substrate-binding protein
MKKMMRRSVLQGSSATMMTIGAGFVSYDTAAQEEDLYQAAKKEGRLTRYDGIFEQKTIEAIIEAFKAKYPSIDVQLLRQPSQSLYTRLRLEIQNGVIECDTLGTTNILHFVELKKINELAAYVPKDLDKAPAAFRDIDSDHTFHTAGLSVTCINYSPQKVPKPPTSWTELVGGGWEGKISVGSPAVSGDVASWIVAMRHKYGDKFLKDLAAQKPKLGGSSVDTVTNILAGERSVGAGAPFSYSLSQKAAGQPIDISMPSDDAILNLGVTAVLKKAPHPNASRLFANFLQSIECSQILAKAYWPTLRTDVPWAEGRTLETVKWYRNPTNNLAAEVAESVAKWREILG